MNKYITLVLFFIIFFSCKTEGSLVDLRISKIRSNCCSKLWGDQIRTKGKDTTLVDYIINNLLETPELINHITNKALLHEVKTVLRTNNNYKASGINMDYRLNVDIKLKNIYKNDPRFKYENLGVNYFLTSINKLKLSTPIIINIDSIEIISDFSVKFDDTKVILPREEIDDLIFPNVNNVLLPMEPIQTFLSKDKKYLYVYIYGKTKYNINIPYISKFIFSKKGYVGKIFVPFAVLRYYGIECVGLIGF